MVIFSKKCWEKLSFAPKFSEMITCPFSRKWGPKAKIQACKMTSWCASVKTATALFLWARLKSKQQMQEKLFTPAATKSWPGAGLGGKVNWARSTIKPGTSSSHLTASRASTRHGRPSRGRSGSAAEGYFWRWSSQRSCRQPAKRIFIGIWGADVRNDRQWSLHSYCYVHRVRKMTEESKKRSCNLNIISIMKRRIFVIIQANLAFA